MIFLNASRLRKRKKERKGNLFYHRFVIVKLPPVDTISRSCNIPCSTLTQRNAKYSSKNFHEYSVTCKKRTEREGAVKILSYLVLSVR